MGGIGSGRHYRWDAKASTGDMLCLSISALAREGGMNPGMRYQWNWRSNGERIADITIEAERSALRLTYVCGTRSGNPEHMDYRVPLDRTPCHFGGTRPWFRCPVQGCGARVGKLYGGRIYACRTCHDLAYPVQREDDLDRSLRRVRKLQLRLGMQPVEYWAPKPKGMHQSTYDRLNGELMRAETEQYEMFEARARGFCAAVMSRLQ